MIKPLPPELMKDPVYAAAFQDDDRRVYSRFKLESVKPFFRNKLSLRSAYEIASASIDALEAVTGVSVFDSGSGSIVRVDGWISQDDIKYSIGRSFGDLERLVYSGVGESRDFKSVSLSMVSAEEDSLMVSVSPDYLRVEISPADSKDGGRPFFAVHPLARVKKGLPVSTAMVWARGVGGLASRLNSYFGSVSVDAAPSHITISPNGDRAMMPVYGMPYFRFDGGGGFRLVRDGDPSFGLDTPLIYLPTGHVVSRSSSKPNGNVASVEYAVGLGLPPQNIRLAVIVRDELDKRASMDGPGGLGLDLSDQSQVVCDYAIYGATKSGNPFIAFSDLQSLCGSDLEKMLVIARRIGNDGISVPADDALAVDMLADAQKSGRVCDWSNLERVNLPLSECRKSRLARAVYGVELDRQIEYVGRKNGSELFFNLGTVRLIGRGANYFIHPCGLGSVGNCNEASSFNTNYRPAGLARAGSILAQNISTEDRCSAP